MVGCDGDAVPADRELDSVMDQPPANSVPESGDAIRSARDKLTQTAQIAHLTNDPMAPFVDALSTTLGALHRLFVDGTRTLDATLKAARQPMDREALAKIEQTLAKGVMTQAHEWHAKVAADQARMRMRRDLVMIAGISLALLVVGFAGGWFWQASRIEALQDTMTGLNRAAFRDGPEGAAQWLGIEAFNHIRDVMGKDCRLTVTNGRRRCETAIWIDAEPATAEK